MVVGPVTPAPGVSKRLSQALESEPKYDQLLFHQGVSPRRGCVKWRTAGGRAMHLVLPDARVPEVGASEWRCRLQAHVQIHGRPLSACALAVHVGDACPRGCVCRRL